MVTYYQIGQTYVAVTNRSPKGFKDVLFLGRGGPLDKIEETAFERGQLAKMQKVALADVPEEWLIALGYDSPPAPPKEDLVVDTEGELVTWLPPMECRAAVELPKLDDAPDQRTLRDVGLLAGIAIGLLLYWWGIL